MNGFRCLLVLLLITPAAAHAQCGQAPTGFGAFLEALTGIFEQASIKFETTRNGVVYQGSIKVKEATCGSTTLQVRLSGARQERERGTRGPASGQVDARAGVAVEYEMTLPNGSSWDDVEPPNPLDPSTIPPGGTIIMRQEAFVALGLEAQYRALVAASNIEQGAGAVVAITRLPDGRIRVAVGPYEVIRNESQIGINMGPVRAGLGRDEKLENGQLRQWTLDPENPDDLLAYRLIMGQGVIAGGVLWSGRPYERVSYISYESAAGIRGRAGPFRFSGNFGQSMGDVRVVTRPDGSRTYTGTFNYRGTILTVTRQFDPQGNQVGEDNFAVTYSGINPWAAYTLRAAMGAEPLGSNDFQRRGNQDVRVQLGPGEWQQWRDRAAEYVRRHPSAPPFFHQLAAAQSAQDVAMAMYYATGFGGSNQMGFTDELLQMTMIDQPSGTNRPLPGSATNPCPNAGGPTTVGNPGNAAGPATPPNAQERARALAQRWCGINAGRYAPTNSGETQPAGIAEGAGLENALGRD